MIWEKTFDGEADNSDIAYSLVMSDIDNSVYVTGSSKSSSEPGSEDMMTIKLDASTGDVLDTAIYNGASYGEDVAYDIAIDTAGNVFVTGYTASLGGSDNLSSATDYLTMKYSKRSWSNKTNIQVPGSIKLFQNYPNPFNPYTTIKFSMSERGMAKLAVYDILGRQVSILLDQQLSRGEYSAVFDGTSVASGVYFYVLTVNKNREVRKMILIK
jgi:hypothetical protein